MPADLPAPTSIGAVALWPHPMRSIAPITNAFKPLLFLSYARVNIALADDLADALTAQGCRVWLDRTNILVGDDFVRGLQDNVGRCDGLVSLLTSASATSSWCQAEVQRALALRKPVLVVQADREASFPEALERLLRDVQRAAWEGDSRPDVGSAVLQARARRHRQLARRGVAIFGTALFLVALALFVLSRANDVQSARQRNRVLDRIVGSQSFWSRVELDTVLAPVRNDAELVPLLQGISDDAARSMTARQNAWQALAALREQRQREWRANVPDVRWSGGRIADALWANISYQRGDIDDLRVTRTRIAGVSLGNGPTADAPGLTLMNSRFEDCDLWFFLVNGTQLLDVEFLDSKFRGAELDLSGHAGVRFRSSPPNASFITADVTVFEDSLVLQRHALPDAGVMDLSTPEQEILFDGVQFVRTYFEGAFKPGWFRNSHFQDCVFPPSLERDALIAQGNTVERGVWRRADGGSANSQ